jgi:hypothetical protein
LVRRQILDDYFEKPPPEPPPKSSADVSSSRSRKNQQPADELAIRAPILVQARGQSDGITREWFRFKPALDSYASISTISPATCERIGAVITPISEGEEQFIDLAAKGAKVERIGHARLRIRCGEITTTFRFEVFDAPDDIILGLDIFPALGFFIGNVPTQWPGQRVGKAAAAAAAAAEAALRRKAPPWALQDRHEDNKEVKALVGLIHARLKANAELNEREAACTQLKEATLELPMQRDLQGSRTYRRQFQTPLLADEAMAKQIEAWLERGFLEAADPHSDFNSPLIAVSKKDLEGKRTGWRICMDLRHINQLLSHSRGLREWARATGGRASREDARLLARVLPGHVGSISAA